MDLIRTYADLTFYFVPGMVHDFFQLLCALYFAGFLKVIRPCTVLFFVIEKPTVRFCAVLRKLKYYGAVRCGFQI